MSGHEPAAASGPRPTVDRMKLMLVLALSLLACVAALMARHGRRPHRGPTSRPGFIYERTATRRPVSMASLAGLAIVWVLALVVVFAQT